MADDPVPLTSRIVAVTFTSEPPEHWQALDGDTLPDVEDNPTYAFTGDRRRLATLSPSIFALRDWAV